MIQHLITSVVFTVAIHNAVDSILRTFVIETIIYVSKFMTAWTIMISEQMMVAQHKPVYTPASKRTWWNGSMIKWINEKVDKTAGSISSLKWLQGRNRIPRYHYVKECAREVAGTRGRLAQTIAMAVVIAMEHRTNTNSLNHTTFDIRHRLHQNWDRQPMYGLYL
jgi:hypothetical protein